MENQKDETVSLKPNSDIGLIRQWMRDEIQLLTEPTSFFRNRFPNFSYSQSIAFGLLFSWVAAFLDWITRSLKHESLLAGFVKLRRQLESLPIWKDLPDDLWAQGERLPSLFPEWGLEGLKMLLNPFHSFVMFLIYGSTFWLGAKLLVSKAHSESVSLTLKRMIQVTAVASAATVVGSILGFLPYEMGSFLGWIFYTFILVIGISESFQLSRLRSLVVIFLPSILTFVLVACLIGLIIVLLMAVFASMFQ